MTEPKPGDLQRRAAALIRENAARAISPSPWSVNEDLTLVDGNGDAIFSELRGYDPDTEHIASWHPAVALAVAKWLDTCADILDGDAAHGVKLASTHGSEDVARDYLREPA